MISAREQLQGMAGKHDSDMGKVVSTPMGFGAVTSLFADMRRHYPGTWFYGIQSQQDLINRARQWKKSLGRFSEHVIEDAMAEVIARGDIKHPSLGTMFYLCQKITDENNQRFRSGSVKQAHDVAMAKIKNMGVIRG